MSRPAWIVAGLALLASCAGAPSQQGQHAAEAFKRDPCVGPHPKSAIASDVRFDGDSAFRGRVLTVTGEPVPHSMLILEPGGHGALADSLGRFQFEGVPRGRYLLRVLNIGYMSVEDSVTYSEWGVEVLAALAISRLGLFACVRAAEPTDSSAALRRSTDLARTGSIRGRVTDDEGDAIRTAQLVVVEPYRGAITDETGEYVVDRLAPGEYWLKAVMICHTSDSARVIVRPGRVIVRDFELRRQQLDIC